MTGQTEGKIYDFYINGDFGFTADHLMDEQFSFCLCEQEYNNFMKKGVLDENITHIDNYTYQYGKRFSSEQVYDLISTFEIPPKGYYNKGWAQFTRVEEQLFWDNMDWEIYDLLKKNFPERAKELEFLL
ncbi:hypothetical protein ACU063_06490 [Paenibacillus sp. M.A.Huq-81]